jgi:hypothetical protein
VSPAVWYSSHHHQRQGTSVCIFPVVGTLLPSQHLPCADHCLSPPGKRRCGALSPPTKRRLAGPRSRRRLHAHLPWVLFGIRSSWRGDTAFSPSEAVVGAQHVLPGRFLASPEPPSPSFLKELQETLNSRTPPLADHHNRPGPLSMPEELLLTRFVLVLIAATNVHVHVTNVQRPVPGSGEIVAFFQNSGGNQARHSFNSSPEAMQVAT